MSKKNNTAKPVAPASDVPTDGGESSAAGTDTGITTNGTTDAGGSEVIAGDASSGADVPADGGDGAEVTAAATDAGAPAGDLGGEAGSLASTEPADELVKVKLLCSNHLGNIGEVASVPWHHVADLEAAGLVDSHPASVGEE